MIVYHSHSSDIYDAIWWCASIVFVLEIIEQMKTIHCDVAVIILLDQLSN